MTDETKRTALCGASAYDCKYYLNEQFAALPPAVKNELKILCTLFTEEVGGVFALWFEEDGSLAIETAHEENDIYYDEVSSGLMVRAVQSKRSELFASLEMYYKVFVKKENNNASSH